MPAALRLSRTTCAAFSFDDVVPSYGVTSRAIVKALQKAVHEAGVPHPLHVHCNNLGLPGNFETALTTIAAAEDCRCISRICSSTATARRAPRLFLRRAVSSPKR